MQLFATFFRPAIGFLIITLFGEYTLVLVRIVLPCVPGFGLFTGLITGATALQ